MFINESRVDQNCVNNFIVFIENSEAWISVQKSYILCTRSKSFYFTYGRIKSKAH